MNRSLPARYAVAPNSDSTIGRASDGALTSSAMPRVSTVIANRKNWQQACSAATRRMSSPAGTALSNSTRTPSSIVAPVHGVLQQALPLVEPTAQRVGSERAGDR